MSIFKISDKYHSAREAFTLAEILVTLLIIGIVATITIVNLVQKTQEAEMKNAWKKAFANISNVYAAAYYENSASFGWGCDTNATTRTKYLAVKSGMQILKSCEGNILGNCWAQNGANSGSLPGCNTWWPSNLNGSSSGFVSADGMFWILHGRYNGYACPYIAVDVNGSRGPNKWGFDTFGVALGTSSISSGGTSCIGDGGKGAAYLYQ